MLGKTRRDGAGMEPWCAVRSSCRFHDYVKCALFKHPCVVHTSSDFMSIRKSNQRVSDGRSSAGMYVTVFQGDKWELEHAIMEDEEKLIELVGDSTPVRQKDLWLVLRTLLGEVKYPRCHHRSGTSNGSSCPKRAISKSLMLG